MSTKQKIDYWESDEQLLETVSLCAWELAEMIDQRIANKSRGAPSKAWRAETNALIDEYNKKWGYGYKRV